MREILPMQLQSFYNEFAKTASKSYMDKMRVMINALFREAVENGICEKNPTLHLKVPHVRETVRQSYTFDEVKTILEYAMSYTNPRTATALMTLIHSDFSFMTAHFLQFITLCRFCCIQT